MPGGASASSITRAGREAIPLGGGCGPDAGAGRDQKREARHRSSKDGSPAIAGLPRSGSKQALLVALLAKDKGATLAALVEATGWLPHTTRAAVTGLRKRGFAIERTRHERLGSLYRIVGARTASVGA